MAAYIIAQINVTDPAKYQEYAKLAGPPQGLGRCR
jgi:uncharacterized protein (DUF1330 family)